MSMPETDDRHPDEIAQELIGNLPPHVRGPLLSSYIGTQVCHGDCSPGSEPANKCRRDVHDDYRACVESCKLHERTWSASTRPGDAGPWQDEVDQYDRSVFGERRRYARALRDLGRELRRPVGPLVAAIGRVLEWLHKLLPALRAAWDWLVGGL